MRDAYDRLHYTTPAAVVAPVAIAAAVVLEERLSAAGIKAVLIALVLVLTNPVLGHATARAARIREFGQWTIRDEEREGGSRSVIVLEVTVFLLVAAAGTAVVLTRDPLNQAIVASFYGLILGIMFFVYQAPDVALSQIVVGAVALPLMILLALAKVRALAGSGKGTTGDPGPAPVGVPGRGRRGRGPAAVGPERAARLRRLRRPLRRRAEPGRGGRAQGRQRGRRRHLRLPRDRHHGRGVHPVRGRARGGHPAPGPARRDRAAARRGRRRPPRPRAPPTRSGWSAWPWSGRWCCSASTWSPTAT